MTIVDGALLGRPTGFVAVTVSADGCAGSGRPPVPIRVLVHGDVWFESEDVEKLTAAFETRVEQA